MYLFKKGFIFLPLLFALLLQGCTPQPGETLEGKIVKITDGDTVTLEDFWGSDWKIRLDQIDAPERDQPGGSEATNSIKTLLDNQVVMVLVHGKDRYDRLIGTVYVGEADINLKLVAEGRVWVYRQYLRDPLYAATESEAQHKRLGLWSYPEHDRLPPWEWRKAKRSAKERPAQLKLDAQPIP